MPIEITGGYVSADSHVVEPSDLWTTQMDENRKSSAVKVAKMPRRFTKRRKEHGPAYRVWPHTVGQAV